MRYGKSPLVLVLVLSGWLAAGPAVAGSCVLVEGEVHNDAVTLESYSGEISMIINGRRVSGTLEGYNLGFVGEKPDGTQLAVTSTNWRIREGGITITTFEDAQLLPTDTPGLFDYVGRSVIKTGNKRFNCGEMVIQGEVDFNAGTASFPAIRGQFCLCD